MFRIETKERLTYTVKEWNKEKRKMTTTDGVERDYSELKTVMLPVEEFLKLIEKEKKTVTKSLPKKEKEVEL